MYQNMKLFDKKLSDVCLHNHLPKSKNQIIKRFSLFFPGGQNTLKNQKKTMSGNIYCGHRLIFLYMLVYIRTILGFFNRSIAFSRFS